MFVDQAFTLEAGRTIWGFPKVMADFMIRDGNQFGFDTSIDGQLVIGMEFRPGLPVPGASRKQDSSSYSHRDGVRRESHSRCRRPACVIGRVVCGCGSGITPTRKNSRRLGLPKRATGFDFV